ncbi:MAG: NAD(P)-dependent oxidoreductase [Candidatus Diapherotrites archaeon]|nr:NAD(P)-dependent oxidoreductase [Candidatus Diapherotrites archaeon]MDZ4256240.1 NAD(P)-dependent oxidoreductase [archaeon]
MPRVFLTGATGEIGQTILPILGQHHDVVALHRGTIPLTHSDVTWVEGNLTSLLSFRKNLEGVDVLIHLGALTKSTNEKALHRVNVQGTLELLKAAREAGCSKTIVASTAAVTHTYLTPYARSKLEMETQVLKAGYETLFIRPTLVYGKKTRFIRLLRRIAETPFPFVFLPDGGKGDVHPVHAEDIGHALLKLIKNFPRVPETYDLCPLTGATLRACVETSLRVHHQNKTIFSLPSAPLKGIGLFSRASRIPIPSFIHGGAAISSSYQVNPQKFQRDYGDIFREPLKAIEECLRHE